MAFRPKPSATRLTKGKPPENEAEDAKRTKELLQVDVHPQVQNGPDNDYSSGTLDRQTGERQDHTAMLHSLVHHGSMNSLDSVSHKSLSQPWRKPGEPIVASLSPEIWKRIAAHVTPSEAASLAFSSKTLRYLLGPGPWIALNQLENRQHKVKFLLHMDRYLPDRIFCFPCAIYHVRIQRGGERLKATHVINPLVICPSTVKPARLRLTVGHTLPFTFVQLVLRASRYGPEYGVTADSLSRRYKDRDSEWSHQIRYYIHKGHLLLRVTSKSFASHGLPPSGQRHLLYSREDYTPYFSVCAHWRDGELMDNCKCALSHIPKPRETIGQQLQKGYNIRPSLRNANPIISLCRSCRPMRRCPECPTEYLVELKLAEDKEDPLNRFKQAIVVTRWSDLGDGTTPLSPEWAACNGEAEFDSFAAIGRRTVSGIFEAQNGVAIPGQRVISLNPKNEKLGEAGHKWY
jgi:hypothetical protein